ncbi:MAG: DciA family protein [Collinsella sp.]
MPSAAACIFQAWNKVCAGTREGKHVTGLHYVAERDELIVYTDGASWTQELTMMREIIRARMDACGGTVGNIVVKTTRPGFAKGPRE